MSYNVAITPAKILEMAKKWMGRHCGDVQAIHTRTKGEDSKNLSRIDWIRRIAGISEKIVAYNRRAICIGVKVQVNFLVVTLEC